MLYNSWVGRSPSPLAAQYIYIYNSVEYFRFDLPSLATPSWLLPKAKRDKKGKKIKSPDTISERFLKLSLFSGVLLLSFFSLFFIIHFFVVLYYYFGFSVSYSCVRGRREGTIADKFYVIHLSLSLSLSLSLDSLL